MKKVFFVALAATTLTVTSCSKEARLNRKLDGKWETVSTDGVAIAADEKSTLEFKKDKKGKGDLTLSEGPFSMSGTYELIDDTKLIMTLSFMGESDVDTVDIVDYSKKELKIKFGTETTTLEKVD